jgi:hypothetical protein
MEDMATGVLPELTTLCRYGDLWTPSVARAAERLVATRRLSGHMVQLADP